MEGFRSRQYRAGTNFLECDEGWYIALGDAENRRQPLTKERRQPSLCSAYEVQCISCLRRVRWKAYYIYQPLEVCRSCYTTPERPTESNNRLFKGISTGIT